ncbi:DUF4388 domain-containing protein [Deinococcus petrolearius]|uniref:DUF4388 domain-containing protein n=1 Tax=Deinococcus petrolearius TaxID=1751295 RepID=A0ABW1DPS9_9DEIO
MTRLLTILKDPSRAALYAALARQAGLDVLEADGGLPALTQLERTPVAAVVCDADLPDMSGAEFAGVVAETFPGQTPPLHLLSPGGETQTTPQMFRQVLRSLDLSPHLLGAPLCEEAASQLQGQLVDFPLGDLLSWVGEMGLHGHWTVDLGTELFSPGAYLLMHGGDVVYAEYAGLSGKAAVIALMRAVEQTEHAGFRFCAVPAPLPVPRMADLQLSTSRLLLEVAVDLDHAHGAPASRRPLS